MEHRYQEYLKLPGNFNVQMTFGNHSCVGFPGFVFRVSLIHCFQVYFPLHPIRGSEILEDLHQPVSFLWLPRLGKFIAIFLYFFGIVQMLTYLIAWVCFQSLLIPSSTACISIYQRAIICTWDSFLLLLENKSSQTWLYIWIIWILYKRLIQI